jgi:hypothetical protein
MPRRFLTDTITTVDLARPRLLDIDVDRKKRIDDTIDYFGLRHLGADPCGESLLDGPGAA